MTRITNRFSKKKEHRGEKKLLSQRMKTMRLHWTWRYWDIENEDIEIEENEDIEITLRLLNKG